MNRKILRYRKKSQDHLDTRLRGYDAYSIYLIFIVFLSFPRRRESRKWENPTFYETIKFEYLKKPNIE